MAAIVEMKRRNRRFGCRRLAQQIAFLFGVEIDKDVVRRVLAKHCRPTSGSDGPSWLTFLGHAKDSLWSVDLFRCESLILKTHWVMVVIDQFTEHRHEDLRLADLAAGAIDHFGSLARVVDEALVSGTALKAHHWLGGVQEGTEVIAERAVLQTVRMLGFILLPQPQLSYARPRQVPLDVGEVRHGDVRCRLLLRV